MSRQVSLEGRLKVSPVLELVDTDPRNGYFNAKADWSIDIVRSAHAPPSTRQDESCFSTAAQGVPHPTSEYAPIMGTVHHKNPISAPSPLLRRDFEGVGSRATAFQTSNIDGKAEERLAIMDSIARAIRRLRNRGQ